MDAFWQKIEEQIVKNFKLEQNTGAYSVTAPYDTVFEHVCNILSTKTQLEVDILLEKYPQELINELLNLPDSDLKGKMLFQYLQINNLEIKESVDLEEMLKYYLDLMFHLSDNYNCNPYLLLHNYTTNESKTHVMTHMLAEKICNSIKNVEQWTDLMDEEHAVEIVQ